MPNDKNHTISNAIVIAFIPFFIYLVVFAYESAYARILGISPNLITLSLTDIFDKIIPLVVSLVFASLLYLLFTCNKSIAVKASCILKWAIPITFFIYYYFSTSYPVAFTLRRIMISVVVVIILFVVRSFKDELENVVLSTIGLKLNVNMFWFLLLTLMCSYSLGMLFTNNMKPYSVIKIEKQNKQIIEKVILRIYGDNIIVADVDATNKTVNNYSIIKLPISENYSIRLNKNIGPLSAEIK